MYSGTCPASLGFAGAGLLPVGISDEGGYELAAAKRLDLLNVIDKFEDAKRKVYVARDKLRPGLLFTAGAALNNSGRSAVS